MYPGLRLGLLDPVGRLGDEEGGGPVERHDPQDLHKEVLEDLGLVGGDEAFHEGKSIVRVFPDVVLDAAFDLFLFVADLELLGQVTILLEADSGFHRSLKQRPSIGEEELGAEGCVLAHALPLEDLLDFGSFVLFRSFLFCFLHFNDLVFFYWLIFFRKFPHLIGIL